MVPDRTPVRWYLMGLRLDGVNIVLLFYHSMALIGGWNHSYVVFRCVC